MSATHEQEKIEPIGAKVSPDLKQRVRVAAAENSVSMSEYLRQALEQATAEDLD